MSKRFAESEVGSGDANLFGNKTGCGYARFRGKKRPRKSVQRNGFVSSGAHRESIRGGFGRQAPVKRCLARTLLWWFRAATESAFRFFAKRKTASQNFLLRQPSHFFG